MSGGSKARCGTPGLRSRIWPGRWTLVRESSASKFQPLGADANTTDGLRPHGGLIDELHAHKNGDLVGVIETGMGTRRQPLLFEIHAIGNRCVDIGAGTWSAGQPLRLGLCEHSAQQRFRIVEVDPATHDIVIQPATSGLCVGVRVPPDGGIVGGPGVTGRSVRPGDVVELQPCNGTGPQHFAFDGDTLLTGLQSASGRVTRQFAVEPEGDDTRTGTALVVGTREVNDAEFVHRRPTAVTGDPTQGSSPRTTTTCCSSCWRSRAGAASSRLHPRCVSTSTR